MLAQPSAPIRIAALYRFAPFDDIARIKPALDELCGSLGVKGTLLLASEGINGTIAGSPDAIEAVLAHVRKLPGCADIEIKEWRADAPPFERMKVRLKREIVTMGEPRVSPLLDVGHYVAPADWNALISDPDTIVVDTRNDYEIAVGTFAGAIDPGIKSFREFPAWFRARRAAWLEGDRHRRIAMFCTGGIRCEKATALLKAEGISEVYHLKGGILGYLEQIAAADSLWQGECFVFDQRITIANDLSPGARALCARCNIVITRDGSGHKCVDG